MTTYNSKVLSEQGGSVLRVKDGGSISVQSGGTISGAGTIQTTGLVTLSGGLTSSSEVSAASITVQANGAFMLGSNIQIYFAASISHPSALPFSASPGAVLFRSDGANSEGYINTSDGATGSIWTAFG